MQVEHGPLQHADGSARFSQGATSVLCSVVGPTEVKPRNELLDRAFIEVIVKPAHGLPSNRKGFWTFVSQSSKQAHAKSYWRSTCEQPWTR